MRYKLTVQVVALVVAGVFVVAIWRTSGDIDLGLLQAYSIAVFLAVSALNLWEFVLWRIPVVQRIPNVPRNVRGTWQGELTSFWTDAETRESPDPKTVFLVIRQTATTVSAVLYTDELRSVSSLAKVRTQDGLVSLEYLYVGRPDARVLKRSPMHHGSASLDVVGLPATKLRGRYWTDRDSRGELDLAARRGKAADSFDSAAALFE